MRVTPEELWKNYPIFKNAYRLLKETIFNECAYKTPSYGPNEVGKSSVYEPKSLDEKYLERLDTDVELNRLACCVYPVYQAAMDFFGTDGIQAELFDYDPPKPVIDRIGKYLVRVSPEGSVWANLPW